MNDAEYIMNLEQSVDSLEYQLEQKEEEIQRLNEDLSAFRRHWSDARSNGFTIRGWYIHNSVACQKLDELLTKLQQEQDNGS